MIEEGKNKNKVYWYKMYEDIMLKFIVKLIKVDLCYIKREELLVVFYFDV